MIHEVKDWMLQLPLEDYVLTFDDGLYSQFFYFNELKKFKTQKYFFISTNILCPENHDQCHSFPSSQKAHDDFFKSRIVANYMKWSQIQEIYQTEGCLIGGHSHNHLRYDGLPIRDLYKNLMKDTDLMMLEFNKRNMSIESFCYPYNKEYFLYEEILRSHNFKYFFGKDRMAIEVLK